MSETHTKGPWRDAGPDWNDGSTLVIQGKDACGWSDVAYTPPRETAGEQQANARLIAAAPEMYRALLDIRDSAAYDSAAKARAAMALESF